jgi:hypothetical protein
LPSLFVFAVGWFNRVFYAVVITRKKIDTAKPFAV